MLLLSEVLLWEASPRTPCARSLAIALPLLFPGSAVLGLSPSIVGSKADDKPGDNVGVGLGVPVSDRGRIEGKSVAATAIPPTASNAFAACKEVGAAAAALFVRPVTWLAWT